MNEWIPGVSVECEICKHELSPDFCTLLLSIKAAESNNAGEALIRINKCISINSETGRDKPVAIKISDVPGYTSDRRRCGQSCTPDRKSGGKGEGKGETTGGTLGGQRKDMHFQILGEEAVKSVRIQQIPLELDD